MNKWQSIDTAPKDGTTILCFESGLVGVVKYEDGWFRNRYNMEALWEPTHWMPLPEPPK